MAMGWNVSMVMLALEVPKIMRLRKLVKPTARMLNMMPMMDWSWRSHTDHTATIRLLSIPAAAPARTPIQRLPVRSATR